MEDRSIAAAGTASTAGITHTRLPSQHGVGARRKMRTQRSNLFCEGRWGRLLA